MKTYQEILFDLALNIEQGLNILLENESLSGPEIVEIENDQGALVDMLNDTSYESIDGWYIDSLLDLAKKYKRVE